MAIRRSAPNPEDDRCGAWGHRTCDSRAYTLVGSGGAALSVGTRKLVIVRFCPAIGALHLESPKYSCHLPTYLALPVHPNTRSAGACRLMDYFFDYSRRDLDGVLDVA